MIISGKHILCISSIDWDFIWQGHQEIMATLAEQGNRVLFVENTGVRSPTLRDLPRLRHRVRNWWRGTRGFRRERKTLFVYSPLILPFPYSRVAWWINRVLLLRALRRWMRAASFYHPIIWTFLPTPLALDLIRELDPALTVYHCVDDLASSSPSARRISRSEAQVFREADLVFVTSEKLRERAARLSNRVYLFPGGVNYRKFEHVRNSSDEVPVDLRELPRPVVGYVGGVHQWVDQELLVTIARCMPEASFALVGPPQTDVSRLTQCPNVHLLGGRLHDDVPRYVRGFDVGIVPYRLSKYTANVYPTKLNEYLAMGIPVVATDLPEIRRFNAEHGDVVVVARDAETFVRAVREAVKNNSPAEAERRVAVAQENSWSSRIEQMSGLIEKKLRHRSEARELRWQEIFLELYGRARRKVALATAVLAFLYFLLFSSPFPWWVAAPLKFADPPQQADAIVVLAGGVGESGKAGQGYEERVKQAVKLFQAGYASRLIFSSGYVFAFEEAAVMKALTVSLGIPAEAILLEKQAGNTYENVKYVSEILDQHGWHTILLVSSPYHMRRVSLVFAKQAPDIRVYYTPAEDSRFYSHGRGASLEQIQGILHEYAAIVVYWWRVWI